MYGLVVDAIQWGLWAKWHNLHEISSAKDPCHPVRKARFLRHLQIVHVGLTEIAKKSTFAPSYCVYLAEEGQGQKKKGLKKKQPQKANNPCPTSIRALPSTFSYSTGSHCNNFKTTFTQNQPCVRSSFAGSQSLCRHPFRFDAKVPS